MADLFPSLTAGQAVELWAWCQAVLGPCEVISDHSREHPGQRASLARLRSPRGRCLVKLHRDRSHWESETHAYEHWAPAFGKAAPWLLAVRESEPLALIFSELPGNILEDSPVSADEELSIWRGAGKALAGLHGLGPGESFGPVHRDGSSVGRPVEDACEYLQAELEGWLARGQRGGFLSPAELAVVQAALEQIPAFRGERPVPCHRDYCPANWLVQAGAWTGVIDFEFSYWDVRTADLSRFPSFDWIRRPALLGAFLEGYGWKGSAAAQQQLWVSQVLYALTAVVWGSENEYFGYAGDGRKALNVLGGMS
jgi:Ser/Thr protein kinase RdoA (MazF antagonist)